MSAALAHSSAPLQHSSPRHGLPLIALEKDFFAGKENGIGGFFSALEIIKIKLGEVCYEIFLSTGFVKSRDIWIFIYSKILENVGKDLSKDERKHHPLA